MNAILNPVPPPVTRMSQTANPGLLAMQYRFTLPADYDMTIIRQRIASNGHRLNGFPNLIVKAFAYAARDYNGGYHRDNCYAPFYLWQNPAGMQHFLESPGFAALAQSFGWPVIRTWSVWCAQFRDTVSLASWATRELVNIPPYSSLEQLQQAEVQRITDNIAAKRVLGAFSAFEPTSWSLVRYQLMASCPDQLIGSEIEIYQVGYMAMGGILGHKMSSERL